MEHLCSGGFHVVGTVHMAGCPGIVSSLSSVLLIARTFALGDHCSLCCGAALQFWCSWTHLQLPRWCSGKESTYQCRGCNRHGFNPWVRRFPWTRKWQPTPVFLTGKSHGQRKLVGYSPWCRKHTSCLLLATCEMSLHAPGTGWETPGVNQSVHDFILAREWWASVWSSAFLSWVPDSLFVMWTRKPFWLWPAAI